MEKQSASSPYVVKANAPSADIVWPQNRISPEARAQLLGQKPYCLWISRWDYQWEFRQSFLAWIFHKP
jgi:hypothetical protein